MQLLAWPVVVLILGIIVILVFKKPLERLIDRTQKVGKGGLEAGSAIQIAPDQQRPSRGDELLRQFDNALLVKREVDIRK